MGLHESRIINETFSYIGDRIKVDVLLAIFCVNIKPFRIGSDKANFIDSKNFLFIAILNKNRLFNEFKRLKIVAKKK